jgi:hypothetical protein
LAKCLTDLLDISFLDDNIENNKYTNIEKPMMTINGEQLYKIDVFVKND